MGKKKKHFVVQDEMADVPSGDCSGLFLYHD